METSTSKDVMQMLEWKPQFDLYFQIQLTCNYWTNLCTVTNRTLTCIPDLCIVSVLS